MVLKIFSPELQSDIAKPKLYGFTEVTAFADK